MLSVDCVAELLLLAHVFVFTQGLTLIVIDKYDLIFLYPAERAREPDGE